MVRHIHDFCVGKPRSIVSSHSGSIDISVGLQEQPLFLPAIDPEEPEQSMESVGTPLPGNRSGSPGATESPNAPGSPEVSHRGSNIDPNTSETNELPSYDNEPEQEALGTVLRGSVVVKLQKPTKIRYLSVDLYGISKTLWNLVPQPGVLGDTPLPSNAEIEDLTYFAMHHWDFVPLEQLKQNQQSYAKLYEGSTATLIATDLYGASAATNRNSSQVQEPKNTTCFASNGDDGIPTMTQLKTPVRKVKQVNLNGEGTMFPAGEYVYHFSIILHRELPESTKVPNGNVKYLLVPRLVRSGAFNPNVNGQTPIEVIRAPLTSSGLLVYNPASLSRIWDNRLVYSISLPQRFVTLDVPTSLTLSLMPLPETDVMVHQVRIYLLESVKYLYSPDSSIYASDSSLKLVLYQQNAGVEMIDGTRTIGNLLTSSEPLHLDCRLLVATSSDKPINELPQTYGRGKLGEKRFVEPDHTSPFVTVKHRLVITLRVSKQNAEDPTKRVHFEIKVDTPITILSKHCVQENIYLPQYNLVDMAAVDMNAPATYDDGGLPTFRESMDHELLSSGVRRPSSRSIGSPFEAKFSVTSSTTPDATKREDYFRDDSDSSN